MGGNGHKTSAKTSNSESVKKLTNSSTVSVDMGKSGYGNGRYRVNSTYTAREYDKGRRTESKLEAVEMGKIARSQSTVVDINVGRSEVETKFGGISIIEAKIYK